MASSTERGKPPRDTRALADAVSYLLDHPELMNQMGAAGRARTVRLYEQGLVQARFTKIVRTALSTLARPGSGPHARS